MYIVSTREAMCAPCAPRFSSSGQARVALSVVAQPNGTHVCIGNAILRTVLRLRNIGHIRTPSYYSTLYYTILYTIYCILYTVYCILYTIYYILYAIYPHISLQACKGLCPSGRNTNC